jgi:hypothetical protein
MNLPEQAERVTRELGLPSFALPSPAAMLGPDTIPHRSAKK